MFQNSKYHWLLLCITLGSILGACTGPQLSVEPIAPTENPSEQINQFDTELSASREQQLNVLAPMWFARAEASLTESRRALEGGAGIADILQQVAYGRAQLQRAEEVGQVVRTALSDVIQARALARKANASSLGKDYGAAEEQFLGLTQAVENDNLDWAQRNQTHVSQIFRDLELRAIKTQTIGEVRQLLKQAEQQRAQRIAPSTFTLATRALGEADAFISENPYAKDMMWQKAEAALFQAQRLQHVADQSQHLLTQQSEDIALWVEDILASITRKLGAPDMRNHPVDTQVENIIGSIAAMQEEHRFLSEQQQAQDTEMTALQQQIATLEGQTQQERAANERLAQESQAVRARLDAERRFQRLFDDVAGQFDRSEAEVYKQGNRLIIRLQALQFPVGKDVIMPANYALLGKVQRAILRFHAPEVIIEGHSDSTGAGATNQHLSERRAEAVRAYLVANRTLAKDKITVVGYGAARPLASNLTPEGRAKNRRIDVIIAPPSPATS
jgi:outer membrane protein OmpA-like peptidoglycan-associated protein